MCQYIRFTDFHKNLFTSPPTIPGSVTGNWVKQEFRAALRPGTLYN